ncbi:23S rRNA (uracil(1939)-C(5))-methyltransferase RlmD [uncultured Zhongshania sp.]|uniref:23S rRNA (uracil(1939)-C(5))-methyltransferase RlmD n=1 Tax=uncultured Zhongshania sp. TaxID=1642288 RepID=UPI0030DB8934|tara:strand:- start:2159 stop:3475 length:1317 start_codon:yes stop_codon:yes gene_type:complete
MAKHRAINTFKPARKVPTKVPSQLLDLQIESLADDGRGVARYNNKVVFVGGALPGEHVKAKISRSHKRFDEAELVEINTQSPDRVTPICAIYDQCGGCQLQHLDYQAQLNYKLARLSKLIDGGESAGFSPAIIQASATGYRHRARLAYANGELGFKAKSSHSIVGVEQCPLLEDAINTALAKSRDPLARYFGQKVSGEVVFSADREGRVGIRIQKDGFVDVKRSEQLAQDIGAPAFLHSVVGTKGPLWLGAGASLSYQVTDSLTLRYQPGDFTQVNTAINRQIIAQCIAWLAPEADELIADYFCGLGNFSLALAQSGAQVMGFDAGAGMIESANQQALEKSLPATYFCADLFDPDAITIPAGCRKVVLDPPRAGAKTLCEQLAACQAINCIVYISCGPASLARDLAILRQAGFKVDDAAMADMFPHTHHVESAVFLRR